MTSSTARRRLTVLVASVCVIASAGLVSPSPASAKGTSQTYIVVLQTGASNAPGLVKNAGGSVVASWSPISVVLARSASTTFATKLKNNPSVLGVLVTGSLGSRLSQDQGAPEGPSPVPAPTSDSEPLAAWQWDMTQINAFAAHEINAGSPDVVVADVDSGLDFTHPDLEPNYDASLSRDCTSGTPTPLVVGNDANGHGTHTAGTIGAAVNGLGITGVAPNVRLAGLKAANDAGFFFPEAVICAYMWIGSHGIDVANNSYFVDPWLYNCRNDADQRAIWNAVRRAISYAQSKGTVVVASEGNESTDLSHPAVDPISPDTDPQPPPRDVTNACAVIPVEIPGVVGVTATGSRQLKSYYSSYGISTADVAAPGGDRRFQQTADPGAGRVLSTWPSYAGCAFSTTSGGAKYCWLQGTSMAGPHVAGVAALLASRGMSGGQVAAALANTATPLACPEDMSMYANFPQSNGDPQECTGAPGHNSFYGAGEVDALRAVS